MVCVHDDVYFSKEQGLIVGLRKHKSVRNSGEFKIPEFDNADGKWLKKRVWPNPMKWVSVPNNGKLDKTEFELAGPTETSQSH